MEDILFVSASTLTAIGSIVVAMIVLRVHMHILKERSIDDDVFTVMKRERVVIMAGLALIVIGYIIEIATYLLY